MKKTALILGIALLTALVSGCDDNSNPVRDTERPPAPQGVYSVTGDHAVEIVWNGVYVRDVSYYIIFRSVHATTGYDEIGRVAAADNPSLDLIVYSFIDHTPVNGSTYYYAVAAVDRDGNESPLSAETVFDTPRPDGSVDLFSMYAQPSLAGLFFGSNPSRVAWNDSTADIYLDEDTDSIFYINAANLGTYLQDVGYTQTFSEIGYAPASGWSAVGWAELILGHTYVIRTADNYYAKMRVVAIDKAAGLISFDWAFQTDPGNRELAPGLPGTELPSHGSEYLKKPRPVAAESM